MESSENILRVGQGNIKVCVAEMIGRANHLIKQETVAEEGINRCGEEELLVLDVEREDKLVD